MANAMIVKYRANPDLMIEIECRDVDEIFQTLGPVQEIFNAAKTCGKCGGTQIRFKHRKTPDGKHDVYELECETPVVLRDGGTKPCRAKFQIGKDQESKNLFPKRYESVKNADGKWVQKTDADGKKLYLPNGGWVHWDRTANNGDGGYV